MAAGKDLGLAMTAARPDRPNRMNDVARRQTACGRGYSLSLRKRSLLGDDLAAMLDDLRPASGVYGAVNAATAHQRRIRGVHNGVNLLACDVGRTGDDEPASVAKLNAQRIWGRGQNEGFAIGLEIAQLKLRRARVSRFRL